MADLGGITGSTISQMIEASTEFKKSGFSDEDSAELANVAQLYRNIADEELTAGESANFVIAQMKAFKDELGRFDTEAERAMFVIDAVNEVSNNFAVSSADLANNIGKVSATMANLGNSYEQTLGMMTAVTEVTRNASMASRGLRQISSRLVQVLDDNSSTGKKLTEIYEDLGIELYDSQGQLRSTYDILQDLSKQWDNLSTNQRDYIALTSAGANQVQNFTALMENFGTAIDATATAEGASGSAMKENAKAMDSIEKKVNKLRSEFEKLVWGDKGGLNSLLKMLLDVANVVLKFANSDIGKITIAVSAVILIGNLFTVTLSNISKKFTEIALKSGVLAGDMALVSGATNVANVSTLGFTGTLKVLGSVIATHPLMTLATVVTAVGTAFYLAEQKTKKETESLDELGSELKEAYQEIEETEDKLEKIESAIDKINKKNGITLSDERQLTLLESEKQELEGILLEERKLAEYRSQRYEKAVKSRIYDTGQEDTRSGIGAIVPMVKGEKADTSHASQMQIVTESITKMSEYNKKIEETQLSLTRLRAEGKQHTVEYNEQLNELNKLNDGYDKISKNLSPLIAEWRKESDTLKIAGAEFEEQTETYQLLMKYIERYDNALLKNKEITEFSIDGTNKANESLTRMADVADSLGVPIEDLKDAIGEIDWANVVDSYNDYNDALEDGAKITLPEYVEQTFHVKEAIEDTETAWKNWNEAIDEVQDNYETLSGIVDSYNEIGGYTVDNLQELLALSPEYLSMLSMENGQLVLNTQALQDKIIAQAEEAKAIVYDTAVTKLNELASQAQETATKNAGDEAVNTASKWDTETEALQRNNVAKATYNALHSGADESDVNKVLSDMQLELDAIDNLVNNISVDFSKGMGKSAKSTSKATDSVKELNKELEDLKSKYEKVISIIDKKLEKMMDNIEKEKDKVLDGIEDQINALKKLQDSEVSGYKKQIDYLQELQQQEEDYWNEKINALKEANKEMEEQNQLMKLQEALASAQASRVKVMKEGKFQYVQDDKAVDKARQDLIDYTKEQAYNQQLNLLEKMKKQAVSSYDSQINDLQNFVNNLNDKYEQQIKDLEALKDAKEKSFEAQIAQIQAYKDEFDEMVNAYQEEQDRLLVEQMTGINIEAQNWEQRLSNLTDFVNEYNKVLAQLGTDNTNVGSSYSATKTSDYESIKSGAKDRVKSNISDTKNSVFKSSGFEDILDTVSKKQSMEYGTEYQKAQREKYYEMYGDDIIKKKKKAYSAGSTSGVVFSHASGISSIKSDEFALVGDAPNKELVVGSKLNGQLMNLTKGSGVVNASATRTLAGLLNSLGKSSALTSGTNYTANNNSTNTTQNFEFGNISLPNVKDANSFVSELANNFKEYAVQNSHR